MIKVFEDFDYLRVGQMQSLGYSQAYKDEVGNAIGIMGDGELQIVL